MGKEWIRSDRSSSITSSPSPPPSPRSHRSRLDRHGRRRQYSRADGEFASRQASSSRILNRKLMPPSSSRRRISPDEKLIPRSNSRRRFNTDDKLKSFSSRRRLSPDYFETRRRSESQSHRHRLKSKLQRRFASNSSDSDDSKCRRRTASQSHHRQLRRKPTCSRSRTRDHSLPSDDSDPKYHKCICSAIQNIKLEKKSPEIEVLEEKQSDKHSSRSNETMRMNHYYSKSGKLLQEGNLKKALKIINLALTLCPEEDIFLSKIYSRRGIIHSLLDKPKCSFQGFLDWEHAFIIDKDNMEARKNMSKVTFMGANKLYRTKQYDKAAFVCNKALELDSRNGEAGILLQLLKRKIQEKVKSKKVRANSALVPSTSTRRTNAENEMSEQHNSILNEVRRLNKLIEKELNDENIPRALIYVKQALRLYSSDFPDENIFRKLFVLKQNMGCYCAF